MICPITLFLARNRFWLWEIGMCLSSCVVALSFNLLENWGGRSKMYHKSRAASKRQQPLNSSTSTSHVALLPTGYSTCTVHVMDKTERRRLNCRWHYPPAFLFNCSLGTASKQENEKEENRGGHGYRMAIPSECPPASRLHISKR